MYKHIVPQGFACYRTLYWHHQVPIGWNEVEPLHTSSTQQRYLVQRGRALSSAQRPCERANDPRALQDVSVYRAANLTTSHNTARSCIVTDLEPEVSKLPVCSPFAGISSSKHWVDHKRHAQEQSNPSENTTAASGLQTRRWPHHPALEPRPFHRSLLFLTM